MGLSKLELFCALAALIGCHSAESSQAIAAPIAAAEMVLLMRAPLGPGSPVGLSGLARAEDKTLWAVSERVRLLVPLEVHNLKARVGREPIELNGVPAGLDTESIAWLGENAFALGTEAQATRGEDRIFLVQVGETAEVTEIVVLPYAGWGIRAEVNRGIEGLCAADGVLLAGIETVLERDGRRRAPLARYDRAKRTWSYGSLGLVSRTGKLSALDCRLGPDGRLEVVAIERHYGTAWLLRFTAPRAGPLGELSASAAVNLGALVAGVPNMEGVVLLPDERIAVIVDNDTGGVTGPTELLVFAPPAG